MTKEREAFIKVIDYLFTDEHAMEAEEIFKEEFPLAVKFFDDFKNGKIKMTKSDTYTKVMNLLTSGGKDLSVFECDDNCISVIVNDFEGYDGAWNVKKRKLDNENLVSTIQETIKAAALFTVYGCHYHYVFDDFTVVWGYASDEEEEEI